MEMKIDKILADEMVAEHRKLKLEAIEDCMRVKKQLAGFNIVAHQDVYTDWWKVFEAYYECDIEGLHKELETLSAEASKFARDTHWVDAFNGMTVLPSAPKTNYFRSLGEDEMDKED